MSFLEKIQKTKEYQRLKESSKDPYFSWKWWGPYVSERMWGTVREDYSKTGDAWNFFPFSEASYRAYRWGEDGIAGFCDSFQYLILSFAFWNGKDPFLKERLFGLSSQEGNHGEDVKELYYYLEATPTFSYAKYLYKYPQKEFPYGKLLQENKKRGVKEREFELLDTGVFDKDEYFDIFIEYAKKKADDCFVRVEIINRSDKEAYIDVIPQLFFRNWWSFSQKTTEKPRIFASKDKKGCLIADDKEGESSKKLPFIYKLNQWYLYADKDIPSYFTENESNLEKLNQGKNSSPYTKEAFHEKIIQRKERVNLEGKGSKACFHYHFPKIAPQKSEVFYLRLTRNEEESPLQEAEEVFSARRKESFDFYEAISSDTIQAEEKQIQKQALSGMIWNKQAYIFDVSRWLVGDDKSCPPPSEREKIRNNHWRHLNSYLVFSMPDKWEYPWFAAWDLAFHAVSFSLVDIDFAKGQIFALLDERFQHPNGQIPAYEWEFSDVNPPVQAWAVLKVFEREKTYFHKEDFSFLERCFHRLLLNFCWWINVVDHTGKNLFEGGFLGLDNITILDRSDPKMIEGRLDEADASGWMAMFCLNLMKMALILSQKNKNYQSLASKFFEHFIYIAAALRKGYWRNYDMLDKEDCFFYSYYLHGEKSKEPLKIRSLVGIIPFFAGMDLIKEEIKQLPEFYEFFTWFRKNRTHLTESCLHEVERKEGKAFVFSLLHPEEMQAYLKYAWEEEEFLAKYGLRSVSKYHEKNPFVYQNIYLRYEPGESLEKIKGGNSNWRGPIWLPINFLFLESLSLFAKAFPSMRIEVKGKDPSSLKTIHREYLQRLIALFKKDEKGKRAIFGENQKMQKDPHFQDYLLFFEHYHPDTGRGLGASHQTGWSGLIANIIENFFSLPEE